MRGIIGRARRVVRWRVRVGGACALARVRDAVERARAMNPRSMALCIELCLIERGRARGAAQTAEPRDFSYSERRALHRPRMMGYDKNKRNNLISDCAGLDNSRRVYMSSMSCLGLSIGLYSMCSE